uniref:Protein kinase domain-containing protein n=1 Tax=Oryza barthii TaxID=65489 RepID=A0A0D3ER35_9ORYZ
MATVAAAASPFAAPHEMMARAARPAAAAPEATTTMDLGQVLRLSDFDKIADLGDGASGVVAKVRLRGCGSSAVFALKTAHYCDGGAEVEVEALRRVAAGAGPWGSWSPHVVRCHAVFRCAGGEPAMLLELMDAGSLGRDPRRRATVAQLLAHPFVARRDGEACRRQLREIIVETM